MADSLHFDLTETDPPPRFDLWELLVLGAVRSRRWILWTAGAGFAISLAVAILTPNTYTSEAKLFLRIGRREQVTFETLLGSVEEPAEGGPTLQDEIHMLGDRTIYEKVARELGPSEVLLPADPSRYDDEKTGFAKRVMHEVQGFLYGIGARADAGEEGDEALRIAAETLHESTVLLTEPESNVITVRHTSTAPERARDYNRAILDAFIGRHAEQFSIERYLVENSDKLKAAEQRRDDSNRAYFEVLEECGFFDFEAQRPALITELEEQGSELFAGRMARAEKGAERQALLDRLKGVSTHTEVVRERAINPAYLDLREQIQAIDVELAALDVRIEQLTERVAAKRDELVRLRECEKRHAYLATVRETQETHYQTLLQRYSLLEDLASIREEASNLSVLQQPDISRDKVGPRRGRMIAIGVLGGLLAGVLLALLRELLDRRLRYPQAVERVLGVRVLDVIPEVEAAGEPQAVERSAA